MTSRSTVVPSSVAPDGAAAGRGLTRVAHVRRYTEIVSVLVRYGFVDIVDALHLRPYLTAGRRVLSVLGHEGHSEASRPVRLRRALEDLGPTFVKLGQALSIRTDVLPAELTAELSLLQDAAPSLPAGVAERAIEQALGCTIQDVFLDFEPEPLAAASIAQVHRATLHSGEVAAVKVRRPGIEAVIEADLAILGDLAALAARYMPDAALYGPEDLVAEFARTIRRELDLVREGRLIERVASQFAGDPTVRFPRICWPLSTPAVLTMEFLDGVKVSAVGTPEAPDLDPQVVARRGADAVLKQILVNGLFHADPHPGNILILPGNVVAFVDFGIVGRVNRETRDRLTETILAVHAHDADRLMEIVVSVATPLQPVDRAELSRDIEEMLDVYADLAVGDLSLAAVLRSITDAIARHRLKLPADLLLLIKAVSTIEAVGCRLDPGFRMVAHATPFVQFLLGQKLAPAALALRTTDAAREMLSAVRTLPASLAEIAHRVRADGLQVQFVHRNLEYFAREMDRSSNRLSFAVVIAAIVIGSSIMVHAGVGPQVLGYPLPGLAGLLAAALLGIGLAIGVLRSGRL
jgi:ubiquinone biosynthesis protein